MLKRYFPYLCLATIFALQIWFAFVMFQYPYLGVELEQTNSGHWIVKKIEPNSGGELLGIKVNDEIINVDGKSPSEHTSIIRWRYVEQAEQIKISRDNEQILLTTNSVQAMGHTDVLPLVAQYFSFGVFLFLWIRLRDSISSRYLAIIFIVIGLAFMATGASTKGDALAKFIVTNAVMVISTIFLHFLIVFFEEKGNETMKIHGLLKYLYFGIGITLLFRLAYFTDLYAYKINKISFLISIYYFLIGLIANLFVITYLYIKYRKTHTYLYTVTRAILFALILSIAPILCLSFLPLAITGYQWVDSAYSSWFIMFFPLSFAYLINTRQILDVGYVLRRWLYTMLIALLPTLVILTFIYFIFQNRIHFNELIISFLIILMCISILIYSLEYIITRLEKIMFPRKYFLQLALKNIANNLKTTTSFHELKDIILGDIVRTLQVFGGAIIFRYQDSTEIISEGIIDEEEIEYLLSNNELEHETYSFLIINSHEEYTSYLVMSQKKSHTKLSIEEIDWLKLIVSYLAVSLENIYLIRKLTLRLQEFAAQFPNEHEADQFVWFRKLMFELQEKERFRIATDLHDTTMQDLFFLKRRLANFIEIDSPSAEQRKLIEHLMDYVDIINVNLRQSCFELYPHLLQEVGLIRTIERTIDQEKFMVPYEIEFRTIAASSVEQKSMEAKRHIFRMIQELMNNARKHSEASLVQLLIETEGDEIVIHYKDDGIGMAVDLVDDEKELETSGIGLLQLKSRVLYLEGKLSIESTVGNGVTLEIRLPK